MGNINKKITKYIGQPYSTVFKKLSTQYPNYNILNIKDPINVEDIDVYFVEQHNVIYIVYDTNTQKVLRICIFK